MTVAGIVVSALLIVVFVRSALPKIRRSESVSVTAQHLDVPVAMMYGVGYLEILGSVGLAAGMAFAPFGIAAAGSLALLMLGATGSHLRVRDYATSAAPLLIAAVAAALVAINCFRV
ncbi:DoxX family protein [Nocardia sp. BSTN01]|uniref:DoxX family protein n=1 Tax=Nocardia sp. BSTN01 TaxID=2783665 RepID=UPI0018905F00|nr:DoxX family protein [Nocardia sp. BSTN01]MBF5001526.1 DoxX family protein [Nocardia sp. BSTN01]